MTTKLSAIKKASRAAVDAQRHRDETIRAASADGLTIRAIAAAAGLSHGRIHQIVQTPWTDDDSERIRQLREESPKLTQQEQSELKDLRLRETIEVTRLRIMKSAWNKGSNPNGS